MTDISPIYSPSRGGTMTFQRCPRLWDYQKRWEPYEEWTLEKALGLAIHAVLASSFLLVPLTSHDALEGLWQEGAGEMPVEAATEIVSKVVREALKIDLMGRTGTMLAVEQAMGPEQCHPDLVIGHKLDASTCLHVVDWKFSYQLKPEWVPKRLASYETLWQLWHYAWRVQQEYQLPCTQVTVVQLAATPKPTAKRVDYAVTPGSLKAWESSAREWWALMAAGFRGQNWEGCRKYGEGHLCPFYEGCHRLASDETHFDTLYRRKA